MGDSLNDRILYLRANIDALIVENDNLKQKNRDLIEEFLQDLRDSDIQTYLNGKPYVRPIGIVRLIEKWEARS